MTQHATARPGTDGVSTVPPSDFFVRLIKTLGVHRANCTEDFLTECFAAALAEDEGLASRFVTHLDGPARRFGGTPRVDAVQTQVSLPGSCLDLVLQVNGRERVAVEIKLDATEGKDQLAKYLRLDQVDHLAFLTPSERRVDLRVTEHPKYLRSTHMHGHFLWSDFYGLVTATEDGDDRPSSVRRALVGLFDFLGFAPPTRQLGDLHDPDPALRAERRQNLRKLLSATRQGLAERGWMFEGAKPGEIWTQTRESESLTKVWLDAVNLPGSMKLRLYFPTAVAQARAAERLRAQADAPLLGAAELLSLETQQKQSTARFALEIRIALRALLEACEDPEAIGARFRQFTFAATDLVSETDPRGEPPVP